MHTCISRASGMVLLIIVSTLLTGTLDYTWAADRPPNVIFILADDLGWGDLRSYGNQRGIRTPATDRLAREGTLFTQFYTSAAVCSPSRVALMTGRFPGELGFHTVISSVQANRERGIPNFLDPRLPTITRILHDAGWATAHFGKWHLTASNGHDLPTPAAYGIDAYRAVGIRGHDFPRNRPHFMAHSADLIIDETLRFIRAHRHQPFYVNVWMLLPHAPLDPTEEQLAPYARFSAPGVPHKGARQIYYASVTALENAISRLLEKLDAWGLANNTIILFSSDNGPEIPAGSAAHSGVGSTGPFRGRKRSLYEGGIRAPLIVRWPGHVRAGRVDTTSVLTTVDFLPTLCALTDVAPRGVSDGEDVSDILLGRSRARRKPLYWEWRWRTVGSVFDISPTLAMRQGPWKLLINPDRSRVELYDVLQDPSEVDNVADRHKGLVDTLSEQLLAWKHTLPESPSYPLAGNNDYPWPQPRAGRRTLADR